MPSQSIKILLVDDEPNVLYALHRQLRSLYEVHAASSGQQALDIMQKDGPFSVIVSDMQMPYMNGAAFLKKARALDPDAVRVLLTGHANLEDAIEAINEGQIFQFLTKPCSRERLLVTITLAERQRQLVESERVLLEQTLLGSIKTLTELLSLASPAAFGRANRAKGIVMAMLDTLAHEERWPIEVAAMLSQVSCITLPKEVSDKLYQGAPLDAEDQEMVDRLATTADELLAHIPRLEPVREVLRFQAKHYDGKGYPEEDQSKKEDIPLGARLLKLTLDYVTLEDEGNTPTIAFSLLRDRKGWYDPALLDLLETQITEQEGPQVQAIAVADLKPGLVLAADVMTQHGMLLVAKGQTINTSLYARIKNVHMKTPVQEPIHILLPEVEKAEPEAPPADAPVASEEAAASTSSTPEAPVEPAVEDASAGEPAPPRPAVEGEAQNAKRLERAQRIAEKIAAMKAKAAAAAEATAE